MGSLRGDVGGGTDQEPGGAERWEMATDDWIIKLYKPKLGMCPMVNHG